MAASWRIVPRHLFSDALRVRPVQVKALPSNLSFSTKTRSPIARTFCFNDNLRQFPRAVTTFVADANLGRCEPSRKRHWRTIGPTRLALPSCYLGKWMTFANNKIARPTKLRELLDVHDMLTYGIHYVGQVAHTQKSNQHGKVVVLYESVITLVP